MNKTKGLVIGLMPFLLFIATCISLAYAEGDFRIESKVKMELEESLSHLLQKDQFLIQVSASIDTISERKLVEGETFVNSNVGQPEIVIPPLPGFQPEVKQNPVAPSQSRQVFKMVERQVLKEVFVQLTLDESLIQEQVTQAKLLVQNYLGTQYKKEGRISYQQIKMIKQRAPAKTGDLFSGFGGVTEWLPWAMLAGFFILWFMSRKKRVIYPTSIVGESPSEEIGQYTENHPSRSILPRQNLPPSQAMYALPAPSSTESQRGGKRAIPALPTSQEFVDRRAALIELFLKNTDVFRLYYKKLPEHSKSELYTGLRGPALESLFETLEIDLPKDTADAPPSEEQMLFYQKNFQEFLSTQQWQNTQFFGYLRQLTPEQLLTLIKQENPLVAALMIKFMNPDQSAKTLNSLGATERTEILCQFSRIKDLATDELNQIEAHVREKARSVPKIMSSQPHEEVLFWTRILTQSDNQDQILSDIEQTRPELYPYLARYRFKLEDVPSLPNPLIQKVLCEADNQELALALLDCGSDIKDFVLSQLVSDRRSLVSDQLVSLNGLPVNQIKGARKSLTTKFREVML